jgi:hypothetical protein
VEAVPHSPEMQMSQALPHPVTISKIAVSKMNLRLMAAQ